MNQSEKNRRIFELLQIHKDKMKELKLHISFLKEKLGDSFENTKPDEKWWKLSNELLELSFSIKVLQN